MSSGPSYQPNVPLDLDPGLQALLKDVDMSLVKHKGHHHPRTPRELEALPATEVINSDVEEEASYPGERKSPAALFGGQRIGAVVLPLELQNSINRVVAESDKSQLHQDAKRIFRDPEGENSSESQWETQYDVRYRSRRDAVRRSERDSTAFVSIALPAHYSAIYSVLDHVKGRLEPEWKVQRVIDWGAGTGSGLWACLHVFQTKQAVSGDEPQISQSSVLTYLGVEKRDGLVAIGKRLLRELDLGPASLTWQKSFRDENKVRRSDGHDTLALSAFMLSSLPTPLARKALIKEMWTSGAHTIVLIDHSTPSGFDAIAEAREYLLSAGRKEMSDPATDEWSVLRGSHVVAPCPHDGACPLRHTGSTKLVCGFSQRLQRPAFVRLTKHSGIGHEDIGYSYVVVRRGSRPVGDGSKLGRVGEVGKRAMAKEALSQIPLKELTLHGEHDEAESVGDDSAHAASDSLDVTTTLDETISDADLAQALRIEAFSWPRLVFPPLKRSGHIILDSCTAQGKIMRLTIPKSQGKQAYYDARKSSWGDMFPHEPKNAPQERYQPMGGKQEGGAALIHGADIGKRRKTTRKAASYSELSNELKEKKKQSRRDRIKSLDSRLD